MTPALFGLILLSVGLGSCAQLLLKLGVSSTGVREAMAGGPSLQSAFTLFTSPLVIGGLAAYGASAAIWLLVLSKLDLSVAYPFVGLGFIATLLIGWLVLGEPVGALRIGGTLLIACGVILVARSA
ncbi:EamA family transporter [soil metagenome]